MSDDVERPARQHRFTEHGGAHLRRLDEKDYNVSIHGPAFSGKPTVANRASGRIQSSSTTPKVSDAVSR